VRRNRYEKHAGEAQQSDRTKHWMSAFDPKRTLRTGRSTFTCTCYGSREAKWGTCHTGRPTNGVSRDLDLASFSS
jgi:hypothetical protein